MALPVPIIGNNFAEFYREQAKMNRRLKRERAIQRRLEKERALAELMALGIDPDTANRGSRGLKIKSVVTPVTAAAKLRRASTPPVGRQRSAAEPTNAAEPAGSGDAAAGLGRTSNRWKSARSKSSAARTIRRASSPADRIRSDSNQAEEATVKTNERNVSNM